jgi:hypothetical protein
VAIWVHGPAEELASSIAKPDSLLELSRHDKVIALMEMLVALRFDGAKGAVDLPAHELLMKSRFKMKKANGF